MNAGLNPGHLIDVVNGGENPSSAIALLMVGAVVTVHAHFGFYMKWFGQQKGEGFEYHLLAIGLAAAVLVRVPGLSPLMACSARVWRGQEGNVYKSKRHPSRRAGANDRSLLRIGSPRAKGFPTK
jgi:hypothetical protein